MKKLISRKLLEIQSSGAKRILFYGVGDEMEVAYITLQGVNLTLVGIVDDDEKKQGKELFGYRVQRPQTISSLRPEVVLITSLTNGGKIFEGLKKQTGIKKILIERL
jgi:FlaA1/EpsC-like NDP-sugar epimerase